MNYKATDIDGSWATIELEKTIKEFNAQSSRQTQQMLHLTKIIAWLTFVMLLAVCVQIYLAFRPLTPSQPLAATSASPNTAPATPTSSGPGTSQPAPPTAPKP